MDAQIFEKTDISSSVAYYVVIALHHFAERHRLSPKEAVNYLARFGGFEFLEEFYDIEHTLSFQDCAEDLTTICAKNGGALR